MIEGRALRGLTKSDLAERSGVSRQMVAVVERGSANPTLDVVAALFDGVGLDVDLTFRGAIAIGGPRQRDAAHAVCSGYLQRRLEAAGWITAREVRIEDGRYLGWIDLMAFHRSTGTLLVIEVKTRLEDLGAIERALDWYDRSALNVARRLGWAATRRAAWLICLASDEVDDRLIVTRSALAAAFPSRAPNMRAVLDDPAAARLDRGLALIDPRSRRRSWLIRARIDGRRSAAPYLGYADFMTRQRAVARRRPRSTGT